MMREAGSIPDLCYIFSVLRPLLSRLDLGLRLVQLFIHLFS